MYCKFTKTFTYRYNNKSVEIIGDQFVKKSAISSRSEWVLLESELTLQKTIINCYPNWFWYGRVWNICSRNYRACPSINSLRVQSPKHWQNTGRKIVVNSIQFTGASKHQLYSTSFHIKQCFTMQMISSSGFLIKYF